MGSYAYAGLLRLKRCYKDVIRYVIKMLQGVWTGGLLASFKSTRATQTL